LGRVGLVDTKVSLFRCDCICALLIPFGSLLWWRIIRWRLIRPVRAVGAARTLSRLTRRLRLLFATQRTHFELSTKTATATSLPSNNLAHKFKQKLAYNSPKQVCLQILLSLRIYSPFRNNCRQCRLSSIPCSNDLSLISVKLIK
jgi:hypothetical protein